MSLATLKGFSYSFSSTFGAQHRNPFSSPYWIALFFLFFWRLPGASKLLWVEFLVKPESYSFLSVCFLLCWNRSKIYVFFMMVGIVSFFIAWAYAVADANPLLILIWFNWHPLQSVLSHEKPTNFSISSGLKMGTISPDVLETFFLSLDVFAFISYSLVLIRIILISINMKMRIGLHLMTKTRRKKESQSVYLSTCGEWRRKKIINLIYIQTRKEEN